MDTTEDIVRHVYINEEDWASGYYELRYWDKETSTTPIVKWPLPQRWVYDVVYLFPITYILHQWEDCRPRTKDVEDDIEVSADPVAEDEVREGEGGQCTTFVASKTHIYICATCGVSVIRHPTNPEVTQDPSDVGGAICEKCGGAYTTRYCPACLPFDRRNYE